MESTRQQKFARQIQREIGDIFIKEGKAIIGQTFVTVTQVKITPDLGEARIHLSVLKPANPVTFITHLNKHKGDIRKLLGNRIKNTIHHIPQLLFFIDDSLDYVDNINKVMNNIVIPDHTQVNPADYKSEE
ncbi:MAG: 30S ribosome-binding factor RbfA [Bacteroidia bacterium]|nr:30S ribosome-binding factor RbfA [Bacteroidia bacterium]HQU99795.1 30S ribosome-binding factor RbfA [Bacteroidia bacterium]